MIVIPILILVVVVILIAGTLARVWLLRRTAPPGRLVDVGGYRLHLLEQGEGGPTVVFDAGAGAAGLAWAPLQREVARFAHTVSYDRAGLGWSEPGRRPRRNAVMVEELHELLHRAGVPGPYVLVGHSLGGLNARLYTHTYPQEVAGLVLVDAAHEEQFTPEPVQKAMKQMGWMMPIMTGIPRLLAASGLAALRPSLMTTAVKSIFGDGGAPQEVVNTYRHLLASRPGHHAVVAAEMRAVLPSHAEIRDLNITSVGNIPLVVIQHGRLQPQMNEELTEVVEDTNRRLQSALAAQSPQGRLVVAENSGHNIPFDEPEVVLAAIQEVVEAARPELEVTVQGAGAATTRSRSADGKRKRAGISRLTQFGRTAGRWAWRGAFALFLLLLAVTSLGALVRASIRASYLPPGQMVDVGGYKLHIYCEGQGSPTVVVLSGAGAVSPYYWLLQSEAARSTRVCVYDRAGYAWSEDGTDDMSPRGQVEDLKLLFSGAGIEPPYVLVGHSFGGYLARLYAHTYAGEVVGLVMIDSAHEEQYVRYPEPVRASGQAMFTGPNSPVMLALTGLLGSLQAISILPASGPEAPYLPPDVAETATAMRKLQPYILFTVKAEVSEMVVGKSPRVTTLGDFPMIVITHGIAIPAMGQPDDVNTAYEQVSLEMQRELLSVSTNSKQIIAEQSTHDDIPLKQADLVVQAILEVIGQAAEDLAATGSAR